MVVDKVVGPMGNKWMRKGGGRGSGAYENMWLG